MKWRLLIAALALIVGAPVAAAGTVDQLVADAVRTAKFPVDEAGDDLRFIWCGYGVGGVASAPASAEEGRCIGDMQSALNAMASAAGDGNVGGVATAANDFIDAACDFEE